MVCPSFSQPDDPEPVFRKVVTHHSSSKSRPASSKSSKSSAAATRPSSAPPTSRRKKPEKGGPESKDARSSEGRPAKDFARPGPLPAVKKVIGHSTPIANTSTITSHAHPNEIHLTPNPDYHPNANLGLEPAKGPDSDVNTDSKASFLTTAQPAEISSHTPASEIIAHLCSQGCENLGAQLNEEACDPIPYANGGFGDIYRGELKCGKKVAIKTMRLYTSSLDDGNKKELKHAARELYTWSKCHHQNVQCLLGFVQFKGQIGMVSTWEKNGDLTSYIRRNPEVNRCHLSLHIAEGLSYLHKKHIVHGDLKAANILVSETGLPLLADFGNATLDVSTLKFTNTTSKTATSLRWTAPELMAEGGCCSSHADVYALGMTILEVVTGALPWQGLREEAVMGALFRKERPSRPLSHIPIHSSHGNQLWELLESCWANETSDRPDAPKVQQHLADIPSDGLKVNTVASGK